MRVRPARQRPSDRVNTETDKTPTASVTTFLPPVGGWVTNTALSNGRDALVLENFWPTADGIEPRGGLDLICDIPGPVTRLFQHRASEKMFAADDAGIYEFDDASTGTLTATVSGQTSGAWSTYESQTAGGNYLHAVNGVDNLQLFDGTTWTQITGVSTPAITGVDTAQLSHVWGHRNRIFFVQVGTLTAWYLGVNSISGAATALPLSSVFRKGGSLMMGGTWSSDSGSGIDDRCAFVSDAGEVAIYAGSDPGDPNNWSLEGVYDIGDVLGREAATNIGGDLVFGTIDGLIPLSGAVSKDPAQLKSVSIAANIAPDWLRAGVLSVSDWRVTRWPRGNMLIAAPINSTTENVRVFVANLETNAWGFITGWNVGDIQAMGPGLYLGGRDGKLYRAWVGGNDDGLPFICRVALAFNHCGDPAQIKTAHTITTIWKTRATMLSRTSLGTDYLVNFPTPPDASPEYSGDTGIWDVSGWDSVFWADDQDSYSIYKLRRGVSGVGFAFAPQVQITCQTSAKVSAILQRIDLQFSAGTIGQ